MRTKLLFPFQITKINFFSSIFLTSLFGESIDQSKAKVSCFFTIHTFNRFKLKVCIANVVIKEINTMSLISSRPFELEINKIYKHRKKNLLYVYVCKDLFRGLLRQTLWRYRLEIQDAMLMLGKIISFLAA